jgi:hypothetical protein
MSIIESSLTKTNDESMTVEPRNSVDIEPSRPRNPVDIQDSDDTDESVTKASESEAAETDADGHNEQTSAQDSDDINESDEPAAEQAQNPVDIEEASQPDTSTAAEPETEAKDADVPPMEQSISVSEASNNNAVNEQAHETQDKAQTTSESSQVANASAAVSVSITIINAKPAVNNQNTAKFQETIKLIPLASINRIQIAFKVLASEAFKRGMRAAKDKNGKPIWIDIDGKIYTEEDFSYQQRKVNSQIIHEFYVPSAAIANRFLQSLQNKNLAKVANPEVEHVRQATATHQSKISPSKASPTVKAPKSSASKQPQAAKVGVASPGSIAVANATPSASQQNTSNVTKLTPLASIAEIKTTFETFKQEMLAAKDKNGSPVYTEEDFSYQQREVDGQVIHEFRVPDAASANRFVHRLKGENLAEVAKPEAEQAKQPAADQSTIAQPESSPVTGAQQDAADEAQATQPEAQPTAATDQRDMAIAQAKPLDTDPAEAAKLKAEFEKPENPDGRNEATIAQPPTPVSIKPPQPAAKTKADEEENESAAQKSASKTQPEKSATQETQSATDTTQEAAKASQQGKQPPTPQQTAIQARFNQALQPAKGKSASPAAESQSATGKSASQTPQSENNTNPMANFRQGWQKAIASSNGQFNETEKQKELPYAAQSSTPRPGAAPAA